MVSPYRSSPLGLCFHAACKFLEEIVFVQHVVESQLLEHASVLRVYGIPLA